MCSCCYCLFCLHTMFKKTTFFSIARCWWYWWRRCWWSSWWTNMTTRINWTRSLLMNMPRIRWSCFIMCMTMTFTFKVFYIFFNNSIKFKNCFTNDITIIWWWISCWWWNSYWLSRLNINNNSLESMSYIWLTRRSFFFCLGGNIVLL